MDSVALKEPDARMADRMLGAEFGWDERVVGYQLSPVVGNLPVDLYNFTDAADFLHLGSGEQLLVKGSKTHIGYIDPTALQVWLVERFGDTELADAIGETVAESTNPWTVQEPIREIMQERLRQCRAALEQD
jgi:hypothetical protein